MTPLSRRVATAVLAVALVAATTALGRWMLPSSLTPVVQSRAEQVLAPATWAGPAPAEPVSTTQQALTVRTPTGDRDAVLVTPTGTTGERPAVVLLAGAVTRSETSMVPWAEALAAQGVVALTIAKPENYHAGARDFDQLAGDAAAAAQHLALTECVAADQVSMVGMSEGGWVATLAAAGGAPVAGVVSLSGPTVSPGEQLVWLAEDGLAAAGAPTGARLAIAHALSMPVPGLGWTRTDTVEALRRVPVPVLAVFGSEDRIVPVADATSLVHQSAPGPAQVYLASGLGHPLTRAGSPDPRVVAQVAAWVRAPGGSPGGVFGDPPRASAAAVQVVDVPRWHGWLLVGSTGLALLGWCAHRIGPRQDPATRRLANAGLGVVLVSQAGVGCLVALGMTQWAPVLVPVVWVGLKVTAVALAVTAARAVVGAADEDGGTDAEAPSATSRRDLAGAWSAALGGLVAVALTGATGALW